MSFKEVNPKKIGIKDIYHLLISGISPRPIAWVGSIDKNNNHNLAPFSFFNAFGANPPIIGFSPAISGSTGKPKDTLLNIRATKEFTVSIVNSNLVEQASLSSCEYKREIDEFEKAGVTKKKSKMIRVPSVKESPFVMECKLYKIIELGNRPASGNLILGEVVYFHIDKNILNEHDIIDPFKINQSARGGGSWYIDSTKGLFELKKPKMLGIGFDQLPSFLFNCNFTKVELAKLASIDKIPQFSSENNLIANKKQIVSQVKSCLKANNINEAWKHIGELSLLDE